MANLDHLYNHCNSGQPTAVWRLELQKIMHNYAGVYRNGKLLAEGCSKLRELSQNLNSNLKVWF